MTDSTLTSSNISLGDFCRQLAQHCPTPGGGAAAAVAAAIGAATAAMAAQYTTGKKWADREHISQEMIARLADVQEQCIALADADQQAYKNLQRTWREKDMPTEEKEEILAEALNIPARLLACCAEECLTLHEFLPFCNPQIQSDILVAIHLLAGSGRAAWQTVLINKPDKHVRHKLAQHINAIEAVEADLR